MSIRDRDIDEWFRRWSPWGVGRRGLGGGENIFREFEEMRRDMERMFEETVRDIDRVPKELIREYDTPAGGRVREVGPLVYGYSVTIGPDGKPKVREFGNVKSPLSSSSRRGGSFTRPLISSEREPLADVTATDKDVKMVVEMPGVSKQNIVVKVYDNSVEVTTTGTDRKYHEVIEIPPEKDIETATSTYKNGILEITFNKKKEQTKPKGKEVKVE